jgi:hypothetical protein
MTKLRYTPPLDLEIEGTREDLAEIEARIRALADAGAGVIEILADSSGSPTPYQNWLERLVIAVGAGPLVSSVDKNCCLKHYRQRDQSRDLSFLFYFAARYA